MEEEKKVCTKLRSLRRARGLSIHELAEKIGEDYQKVGRIERGKRALTLDCFVKLARALQAPVDTLLDEKDSDQAQMGGQALTDIVNMVEDYDIEGDKKGEFISKLYQLALKFSPESQGQFLASFFEGLNAYLATASNNSPHVV